MIAKICRSKMVGVAVSIALLLLSALFPASAQTAKNKITGTVTDDNGEPLPGVGVLIKGTVSL